mgnify:CR=1 FL=1
MNGDGVLYKLDKGCLRASVEKKHGNFVQTLATEMIFVNDDLISFISLFKA